MKKLLILFFATILSLNMVAQERLLKDLVAEGNKAYIDFVDVKNNIPEAKESINNILLSKEWNRWALVDSKDKADFILKVSVEKKGMNILSMASDGARIRIIAEIYNIENKSLWKSKRYQGNASLFTGFAALDDAMRKLVRRALSDELMTKCNK